MNTQQIAALLAVSLILATGSAPAQVECLEENQTPDSTLEPVVADTEITLELVTSGAIFATIDGRPMAKVAPGVWEATHFADRSQIVEALIGDDSDAGMATCSWTINVICDNPVITDIAAVGGRGVTIEGTPFCPYAARTLLGQLAVNYSATADASGIAEFDIQVRSGMRINVGQDGLPRVTDSVFVFPDGGTLAPTIPTLDRWGLAVLVVALLLFAWRRL